MSPPPDKPKFPHLAIPITKNSEGNISDTKKPRVARMDGSAARTTANHPVPYSQYSADTAPIWSEYFKQAKDVDDRLVGTWNSDLDSLLIFAGLFSAILTAFLIEVRKGLQEDLQEITNTLLGALLSTPTMLRYLALLSTPLLTFSLISALGAVLAKGWVAQYRPASNGTSGRDARTRQLRHHNVVNWHVAAVISFMPIFLHVAFFLFFAGLIVLLFSDNNDIARAVLVPVLLTTFLYLGSTLIPLVYPDCPFKTPVSDFLSRSVSKLFPSRALLGIVLLPPIAGLHAAADALSRHIPPIEKPLSSISDRLEIHLNSHLEIVRAFVKSMPSLNSIQKATTLRQRPSDTELNAEALAWLLSVSVEQAVIRDTVRAIAGMPLSAHLQSALYESGADLVLARGLSDCIIRSPGAVTTINEPLAGAYLHALLRLVQLPHDETWDYEVLLSLVGSRGPLYRWDDMTPGLRVVVYCVQVFILVRSGHSEVRYGSQPSYKREMDLLLEAGLHRYHWQGLAEAVVLSIRKGEGIMRARGVAMLSRLGKHSARIGRWEPGPEVPDDMRSALAKAGVVETLEELLRASDGITPESVHALMELTKHDEVNAEIHKQCLIERLLELLKGADANVVSAVMEALPEFTKHDDTSAKLLEANIVLQLPRLIKSSDTIAIGTIMHALSQFVEYNNMHAKLLESGNIEQLLMLLTSTNGTIGGIVMNAMVAFVKFDNIRAKLFQGNVITELLKQLASTEWSVKYTCLAALSKFLEYYDACIMFIQAGGIEKLLAMLESPDDDISSMVIQVLSELAKHDDIRAKLLEDDIIVQLLKLLQHTQWWVVRECAITLGKFANYNDAHPKLLDAGTIGQLLELTKSSEGYIMSTITYAIPEFTKQNNIRAKLLETDTMTQLLGLVQSTDIRAMRSVIQTLPELATHDDTRTRLLESGIIAHLFNQVPSVDWIVAPSCVEAFVELMKHNDTCAKLLLNTTIIHQLLSLLKSTNMNILRIVIQVLLEFTKHDEARTMLLEAHMVPQLLQLLKSPNRDIVSIVIQALPELAKHNDVNAKIIEANIIAQFLMPPSHHDHNAPIYAADAYRTTHLVAIPYYLHETTTLDSLTWVNTSHMISILVTYGQQSLSKLVLNLLDIIQSPRHYIQYYGREALIKLAKDGNIYTKLLKENIIKQLQELTKSTDVQMRSYTALVLSHLTSHNNTQSMPFDSGIIVQLLELLPKTSWEDLSTCGKALVEFSSHNDIYTQTDIIAQLLNLFKSTNSHLVTIVGHILSTFAKHNDIRTKLLEAGVIIQLVKQLPSTEHYFAHSCTAALVEFAKYDDTRAELLEAGIITQLLQLLENTETDTVHILTNVLSELTKHGDTCAHLLEANIIAQLVRLLVEPNRSIGHNCVAALLALAQDDNTQAKLIEAGVITKLLEMLRGTDSYSVCVAAQILVHFLDHSDIHAMFLRADVLSKLLDQLQNPVEGIGNSVSHALQGLVVHDGIRAKLLEMGLITQLLDLLKCIDTTEIDVSQTLSGLIMHNDIRTGLLQEQLHLKLFELLQHRHPFIRSCGANTLAAYAQYWDARVLLPITDIINNFMVSPVEHADSAPLLCELLVHDDSRPIVLKLDAAHTIFPLLCGRENLESILDRVKQLDSIGVIDEWADQVVWNQHRELYD